jgi:anaerobic ribonucleoside-triphosphate reductase activating protein
LLSPEETLRIHRFLPQTQAEGPGNRACLWVQGCSIHCPGCSVPWTWQPEGGKTATVKELAQKVLSGPPVEGITFLGGEPFDQALALSRLAKILKAEGLSIVTFSGYTFEHLQEQIQSNQRKDWERLFLETDLLIAGPFQVENLDTQRPWVGSSNQTYHFLTPRYAPLSPILNTLPNRLEIIIAPNGSIQVNGLAKTDVIQSLLKIE